MADDALAPVRQAVCTALAGHSRVVLAVSGGADSSVLLDAAAAVARERLASVAVFDHRTGPASARAVALVGARAGALGLPCVVGKATRPLRGAGEDAWRRERWRFLREVAERLDAVVATAHTRDDQLETVLMRALRGAGARGLAGLYAPSDVVRPLLDLSRAEVERYLTARGLPVADDPSNRSRAHLRNRVRLDLIPLLTAVRPTLGAELLALARRAASWRAATEALVDGLGVTCITRERVVAPCTLAGYDPEMLEVLWPAIAARAGVALDRRGTRRLAQFTRSSRIGQRVPLSGGYEVVRGRTGFALGPRRGTAAREREEARLDGELRFGGWRFAPIATPGPDSWSAELPADRPLRVRGWRPGDRMRATPGASARRVKRFLADAHVTADDRARWPVVLAGDEIVWIPGVRRSRAATDRSGRPGLTYSCERYDDVV